MSTLPSLPSSCLAPDINNQRVFLFGVSSPGRLDAYSIDLSNPLSPASTLISSSTSTTPAWDSQQSLACSAYLGDSPPSNSPISIVQFGNTIQALFYPNGTWLTTLSAATESPLNYVSPRTFSLVGSTAGWNWFLAQSVPQPGGTDSWRSIRIGNSSESGAPIDSTVGSDPLLTVGAIAQDTASFGNGLLFSFEKNGTTGSVFRTVGNKHPAVNLTATEPLVNITLVKPVDMNGNILTTNAWPLTSSFSAFVVDKSSVGTIALYSIDPRISSYKLVQSLARGLVPQFLAQQAVTILNSKIIVYGGLDPKSSSPSNGISIFDVIAGTWTGPALVNPTSFGSGANGDSDSKKPNFAMIGGIAAGVAVLFLIVGALAWRRRRRTSNRTKGVEMLKDEAYDVKTQRTPGNQMHLAYLDQKRNPASDSSSTLALTEAQPSTPGTPLSAHGQQERAQEASQQRHQQPYHPPPPNPQPAGTRPGRPSRQSSSHSVRSSLSSGHISLFPASSQIYLVSSPPMLPPTPALPSEYTGSANQRQEQHPSPLRNTSPSSFSQPISRKGSSNYKVNIPDNYDDRQPINRLPSMDGVRSEQGQGDRTLSLESQRSSNSSRPPKSPRQTFRDNPSSPLASTDLISGSGAKSRKPRSSNNSVSTSINNGGAGLSKIEPLLSSSFTSSPQGHAASHRDSGSYKVEYGDQQLASRRQQQQQQQQQQQRPQKKPQTQRQNTPTSASAPLFASRQVASTAPIPSKGYSSSPVPSESDSVLGEFPMPPQSKNRRPAPTVPTSVSSLPIQQQQQRQQQQIYDQYRLDQQQKQQKQLQSQKLQQQMLWQERQEQIHQQQAQAGITENASEANSNSGSPAPVAQSPLTPKLGSLPRPIPRDKKNKL
ncbi:hypothetical protein EMPS_05987 [Entomortierella parvispora]|uniref:Uncharacterized protein n=1 Tax=Entomortierella parvispora TaxID=205924 RepID=A0A9P3LX11_9FUNG|nr:hypothetical protein EMPS_05987 [Entomortierella parvispora]